MRVNALIFEYMWYCVDYVKGGLFSRQTGENAPSFEMYDLV